MNSAEKRPSNPFENNHTDDLEPIHSSLLYYIDNFLAKVHLSNMTTKNCQHRGTCIGSMIVSILRTGAMAYGIKTSISVLFALKKILKSPTHIMKILKDKSSIKFGLFTGSFILIFRSLLCLMRSQTSKEKEKYLFMIAGFIGGGLSVLFLEKPSRQALGLFLIARAIDFTYNSLVEKKKIPQFKYFYILLYSLSMIFTGYCFMNEPGSLSKQTYNFYQSFTNETIGEMQMRQIVTERKNIQLAAKGITPENSLEYIPRLKAFYERLKR